MRLIQRTLLAFLLLMPVWNQATPAAQAPASQHAGEIRGRAVDEKGRILPGSFVGAVRIEPVAQPIVVSAVAADSGTFRLDRMSPGRYFLMVSLPGFAHVTTTIEVSDRPVELPALVMRVTEICDCLEGPPLIVRNPEGQGIPGARVHMEAADGTLTSWGQLDSKGRLESRGFGSGQVLVIDAPGYGRQRVKLPVRTREELNTPWQVTLSGPRN